MNDNEKHLINLIKEKANEKWESTKNPYLISSVGADLKSFQIKDAIGNKRLRAWISEHESELKLKIITQKKKKKKIGLIPSGETYEFPTNEQKIVRNKVKHQKNETNTNIDNTEAVKNFLMAVKSLPKEDADRVIIPTSVLSILLGIK